MSHGYTIERGAVWTAKRDRWREVRITGTFDSYGKTYVQVRRNTSRRRQAIRLDTLIRDYTYARMEATL